MHYWENDDDDDGTADSTAGETWTLVAMEAALLVVALLGIATALGLIAWPS